MAMAPGPEGLSRQQAAVFATIDHYHEAVGEPCPGTYIARKLNIAKQVVARHLESLHRKGWLRGPSAPAVPSRPLPPEPGGVTESHLPTTPLACDVPSVKRGAKTIEMGPMLRQAEVRADRIDPEARTAEVVFSTGAAVDRFDWWTGKRYIETLSLEPGHVRLKRINNSAPLLDAHSSYELRNQIGVVVPTSARIEGGKGTATVRFSKRADVEPLFQDVVDGIVRNVSVGYKVHKFEITAEEGKPELRHAVDWEPYEISAVPMGADDGAKFRGQKPTDTNPCQVVTRGAKETRMDPEETPAETIAEDPLTPPTRRAADPPAEPNEHDEGVKAERKRCQGIQLAVRAARLPQSVADKLIADDKVTLEEAQGRIFQELAKRGGDDRGPRPGPSGVEVTGDDPLVHVRAGIENALLHKVHPVQKAYRLETGEDGLKHRVAYEIGFKLSEEGQPYRGMRMLDVARAYLNARGMRVTSMAPMEIASLALGLRGGLHTTSDFANLLADLPNKILRQAYLEAAQTFGPIVRNTTLADFKPARLLQLGEGPALLAVGEHGEFVEGTMGESKEQYQLGTWGRKFWAASK